MTDSCPACGHPLPLDVSKCTKCGGNVSPPNVRYSARLSEKRALSKNLRRSLKLARDNKVTTEVARLEILAKKSKMVINRRLRALADWINSEEELYLNFYRLRKKGVQFSDNVYNRQRISAENTISPNFFDQLVIGALSLDKQGMIYYGEYTVVIRSRNISSRASVFWENPFIFNKKHGIISGEDPPEGYRAPWRSRDRLVLAKLAEKLSPGETDEDLAVRVMGPDRSSDDCDFVEVHVYDSIHANEIDEVVAPPEVPEMDKIIWEFLRSKLVIKGIKC